MSETNNSKSNNDLVTEEQQKTTKRYYKSQRKRIQKYECKRLKKMIPSIALRQNISQLTIIEEATRHIAQLEEAVLQRLKSQDVNQKAHGSVHEDGRGSDGSNLERLFMRSILPHPPSHEESSPPVASSSSASILAIERPQPRNCNFPLPRVGSKLCTSLTRHLL